MMSMTSYKTVPLSIYGLPSFLREAGFFFIHDFPFDVLGS